MGWWDYCANIVPFLTNPDLRPGASTFFSEFVFSFGVTLLLLLHGNRDKRR